MSEQRIVLVTGGNKGLGFETARRLRAAGKTVYIGARNAERGLAAADELGVAFVQLDVTDEESVAAAAAEMEQREGRLDVLVNNAGISGTRKEAAEITGADASEAFETNVAGVVRVTHAFLPLLRRSDAPVIVNVSSGMGSFAAVNDETRVESQVRVPLYSASKAAVTMLTVQYAKQLSDIKVNAADPGYTATDFNANRGTQTVTEGTDAIVELASIGVDGPTGTFVGRDGTVGW